MTDKERGRFLTFEERAAIERTGTMPAVGAADNDKETER